MDTIIGAKTLKESYQEYLINNGEIDKAIEISQKDVYEPVFSGYNVHPEEEPNLKDLNTVLMDIGIDILSLYKEIAISGQAYADMLTNMKLRLDAIEEQILTEEERLKDLNILCGNINEFEKVVTLTSDDFNGNFSVENNTTFMAFANSLKTIKTKVLRVSGNGYEGKNYEITDDNLDNASNQNNMTDDSIITFYEYSRLTSEGIIKTEYPEKINFDNEEAECSIILGADEKFNTIKISSDLDNILLTDVLTSKDQGVTFTSSFDTPIEINNRDAKYESGTYIYGSGVICFPATQYLKLVLKSGSAVKEDISFNSIDTSDASNPMTVTIKLDNINRHIIRVNNLQARFSNFDNSTYMISRELIDYPVDTIAIFANEYIPKHFANSTYFKYILNINGIDYDIVPINSQRNGTKIIKVLNYSEADNYTKHINESIKSAYLTVIISAPNSSETPYLSNIKICQGKAAETNNV